MNRTEKLLITLAAIVVLGLLSALTFRVSCVDFIDNYEFGYTFDTRTGKIEPVVDSLGLPRTGYVITPPFLVKVHTIDLKPMQVCINANSRVLNCKLVKFNPAGFETFISWHGRGDYDSEIDTQSGSLRQILMSYAYDGTDNIERDYPFITILKELQTNGKNEDKGSITITATIDSIPKTIDN